MKMRRIFSLFLVIIDLFNNSVGFKWISSKLINELEIFNSLNVNVLIIAY